MPSGKVNERQLSPLINPGYGENISTQDAQGAQATLKIGKSGGTFKDLGFLDHVEWFKSPGGEQSTSDSRAEYSPESLQVELRSAKKALCGVAPLRFSVARQRSNPFEKLGKAIFQNRASLKLAELDHLSSRQISNPECWDPTGSEPFYYGDICAGPGGFSEYISTVHGWRSRGIGFTLKDSPCDFNLAKFNRCASTDGFECVYGPDGSGDILHPSNRSAFVELAIKRSGGKGLSLVTADGGFCVEGKEDEQEQLSCHMILCQTLVALKSLRKGGTFVCKVFDLFLPCTATIVSLLCTRFQRLAICKPKQSRPANSERYIVCVGFLGRESDPSALFLGRLDKAMNSGESVTELLAQAPTAPNGFLDYLYKSNLAIGTEQLKSLTLLRKFIDDPPTAPPSGEQFNVRDRGLKLWGVPPDRSHASCGTFVPFNPTQGELYLKDGFLARPSGVRMFKTVSAVLTEPFQSLRSHQGLADFQKDVEAGGEWGCIEIPANYERCALWSNSVQGEAYIQFTSCPDRLRRMPALLPPLPRDMILDAFTNQDGSRVIIIGSFTPHHISHDIARGMFVRAVESENVEAVELLKLGALASCASKGIRGGTLVLHKPSRDNLYRVKYKI